MENIYVIDRIEENIVILSCLNDNELIKVKKDEIVGICSEKSVIIHIDGKYVYSEEETLKRQNYIQSLTEGLWN